jgi:uncharacterized cupin superfamily protein
MSKSTAINIDKEFSKLSFLRGRTPETTNEEAEGAFALLSEYRDGGIYIAHYSGFSEWEKHSSGDEFVQILDGKTTLILLEKNQEQRSNLIKGEIFIVPKDIWHRFESPDGVKVMTVTPQPTEHSISYKTSTTLDGSRQLAWPVSPFVAKKQWRKKVSDLLRSWFCRINTLIKG